MKSILSILVFSTFFLTTSCNETQKVINTANNVQLNGSYTINSINEKEYSAKNLVLTFDAPNKSINATTECNNMFGTYTVDLNTLNFAPLASTKMYCDGKMESEKEIGEALSETGTYTIEDNILKLYSTNNEKLLLTATKEKKTNEKP